MRKTNRKTAVIIMVALMLLSVLALTSCANSGSDVKHTVQLKIVAGDDVVFNGPVAVDYDSPSVLDIVNEASLIGKFDFKTTSDQLDVQQCGKYEVKSENNSEYYWKYSVNGKLFSNVKAADVSLTDGDIVQFVYYVGTLNENGRYEENIYSSKTSDTTANTEVVGVES